MNLGTSQVKKRAILLDHLLVLLNFRPLAIQWRVTVKVLSGLFGIGPTSHTLLTWKKTTNADHISSYKLTATKIWWYMQR